MVRYGVGPEKVLKGLQWSRGIMAPGDSRPGSKGGARSEGQRSWTESPPSRAVRREGWGDGSLQVLLLLMPSL